MDQIKYGEFQLHYKIEENKKASHSLIFLHGFLENHSMWLNILPAFAKDYRCVLIDLPCHGETRFKGEVCHMSIMAEAVAALITELQFEEATIIGHSMGGYVGLELLKLQKLRHRLILLNSNFWADPPEKKKDRNRVVEVVKKDKSKFIQEAIPGLFAEVNKEKCSEQIEQLIKSAKEIPAEEIIAATKGMRERSENYEPMRHEHVSIIQGELDPIISPEFLFRELSEINVPIPIKSIPACGHMSCFEKPRDVIEVLNQLLIG